METRIVETSAGNVTIYNYITSQEWKGRTVLLKGDEDTCPSNQHSLDVMHHLDDDGKHYCPTQFLICSNCGAVGDEPKPYECNRWGH